MDAISMNIYMSKRKILFLGILLFLLMTVIFLGTHWRVKEYFYRYKFDLEHPQKAIHSKAEVDHILNNFKTLKYKELEREYRSYSKSEESKYKTFLNQKTYFAINRNDFFQKIAGHFRVEDLLVKDKFYRRALSDESEEYYWLMDKSLLYKLLELQNELENEGYNKHSFGITNGHRHPRYNERIKGAKMSRHIHGEAIDIRIYDIDGNGRYDKKDKEIVLRILENKVIKNQGGIGRYPGTRAVHFDVRGYQARWDSY